MLQYIPLKKRTIWSQSMRIYRGKRHDSSPIGTEQGSHIINLLFESFRLMNKWYHVIWDSSFTLAELAKQRFHAGTCITGTLGQNR
jgi:hypothetical protein